MKLVISLCLILFFSSCGQQKNEPVMLQQQIDSLKQGVTHTYKPGLGEFMLGIQMHHAKLWFAGQAQNWPLAEFEAGEISETLNDIKTFCTDRPEVKSISMIDPAMNSLTEAIKKKDAQSFKEGFILLTNTCNSCHNATHHEFNVIKIPDNPPFSNQDFKAK